MTPEAILAALDQPHRKVPTDLLAAATAQREAITEPLLQALGDFVALAETELSLWEEDHAPLADYALYLLAQWGEARAYPLYLRLCRLPEEASEYWLGDILNEDLPAFLASTCEGDTTGLQELALDQSVWEWGRWAASNALLIVAVHRGAIEALGQWYLQAAAFQLRAPENLFWTFLASSQYDLAEPALMPLLREAYAENLVDTSYIALGDLEGQSPDSPTLQAARARLVAAYRRDAATAMPWLIDSQNRDEAAMGGFDGEFGDDAEDGRAEYQEFGNSLDDRYLPPPPETYVRPLPKTGRNDPCPCGSGKKYKKCCLQLG